MYRGNMKTSDFAYCGLNCELCKTRSRKIREKAIELQDAMDEMNFAEVSRVIPFMHGKYRNHVKLMKFFTENECPGCRENGGNPFCAIRKCADKRGYTTCAECGKLCKKFDMLFRVHKDGELQRNISILQEKNAEALVDFYENQKE